MKLYLKNIGKINEADVEINGITVIGGENNTGKSTVGKSLFVIFNSFYEIQRQIEQERLSSIENALLILYRNSFVHASGEIKELTDCSREILSNSEKYIEAPDLLRDYIDSIFTVKSSQQKKYYAKTYIDDIVDRLIEILTIQPEIIFNSAINKRINAEFAGQVINVYSETEGIISLNVDGEELRINISDGAVSSSGCGYSLHTEAFYIDDPFVLDDVDFRRFRQRIVYTDHRDQLIYQLLEENDNGNVIDEIVVEKRIDKTYEKILSVCDGKIVRQKNYRLGYQMKDSDRALSVKNISTGLKTFVILKTLLMNGTIEHNGMIILDEPEIHLHPEWQLLFAELIVLLNKEFKINILLNTHSPYFLRAIQVYAAKYEVSDVCKYYLSEFDDENGASITDVTDSVDKIFLKLSKPLQRLEDERCNID